MTAEDIGSALSQRLNMQIAISSMPAIEEWMDTELSRWLESIPLPPEMPVGGLVVLSVGVGADMSRLAWGAYGTPGGIIPKLAPYLNQCGAQPGDLEIINAIGGGLEPRFVGSWVAVADGAITTGWQFVDRLAIDDVAPHLLGGSSALVDWAREHGHSHTIHVSGTLGHDQTSLGVQAGEMSSIEPALASVPGVTLPGDFSDFVNALKPEKTELHVRQTDGDIDRISAVLVGVGGDDVASMCRHLDVVYEAGLVPVQGALGAESVVSMEVGVSCGKLFVDAWFAPGSSNPLERAN